MAQKKQKQIAVRLDEETLQKLHELQQKTGLTQSELFRQFITKGKVTCKKKYSDEDILFLISAINKVGNNLNQIALKLNIAHKKNELGEIEYDKILNELAGINYYLKKLLEQAEDDN